MISLDAKLGVYSCKFVTNIPPHSSDNNARYGDDRSNIREGIKSEYMGGSGGRWENQGFNARIYFDHGLRYFYAYQHEEAYKHFLQCLKLAPDCAFAHGMIALCHCPNYNYKGESYYGSTSNPEEEVSAIAKAMENGEDIATMRRIFPSQQVMAKHSLLAMEKVEELKKISHSDTTLQMISDVEVEILSAIRILSCHPGISPDLAEETVGRPYIDALRRVYERYREDAEVCCFFAESLMVLNAWKLYEFPSGRPLSNDVGELESVLENALQLHPRHAGLCHLYVHLSEMSAHPARALSACESLRNDFPDAGHLIHMPTHIDVLLGDYVSCIEYNNRAILADLKLMKISPDTFDTASFYFGYSVHNFHMVVYGGIMGGFESVAMDTAMELNQYLTEDLLDRKPDLALYLESYSALEVHVLIRFGRWEEILQIPFPSSSQMLYRHAILHFARGLALANTGQIEQSIVEADLFDKSRLNPIAKKRTLHNNIVSDVLAVDAPMLRGEIAYFSGRFEEAFSLLRQAVELQDGLNYDEPWGKMQPIRHSLGGLLCDQHQYEEAEQVFRQDLKLHPNNPWALVGLAISLNGIAHSQDTVTARETKDILFEVNELRISLAEQRKSKYADSNDIAIPCACCTNTLRD